MSRLGKIPGLCWPARATAGMTVAALWTPIWPTPRRQRCGAKRDRATAAQERRARSLARSKLAELRRRDVRTVTDAILRRSVKVEATRVFEDVRGMVRWAVENEYLDANPLDGMGKPAEATSSNRVLSDDEIRTLWTGLAEGAGTVGAVPAHHQALPRDRPTRRRGRRHHARRTRS